MRFRFDLETGGLKPRRVATAALLMCWTSGSSAEIPEALALHPVHSRMIQKAELSEKISLTAQCIDKLDTYRQAIRFLDRRLEKSPPALVYQRANGQTLTLNNRVHTTMKDHREILAAGMLAREHACGQALLG